AALLNYGYTFFETVKIKARGEAVLNPRVFKSASEFAPVAPLRDIYVTVERGLAEKLQTTANVNSPLVAPLAAGASIGELIVSLPEGGVLARVPLGPVDAVVEGGLWTQLIDSLLMWWNE